MRLKTILKITFLSVMTAGMAQAASTLTVIGNHPVHQPPLKSVNDLKSLMSDTEGEMAQALRTAGNPELAAPLQEQFPNAVVKEVEYPVGTTFDWMLFRTNGQGSLKVAQDLTWGGQGSIAGYEFTVDEDCKRYTFGVPLKCGNLALMNTEPIANCPEVAEAPAAVTCDDCPPECENNPEKCPAECQQLDCYAKPLPMAWVADIGYLHQHDPADYVFGRIGAEFFPFDTSRVSLLAMVGYANKYDGSDGDDAILIDAFANYNWAGQLPGWLGLGIGGWITSDDTEGVTYPESVDSDLDLIANIGVQVYGEPDGFSVSVFLEARSAFDELSDFSDFGRYGGGLRFKW